MASLISRNTLRLLVLLSAGAWTISFAQAQVPAQNLFRRSQFIEYHRLRNQARINSNLGNPQTINSSGGAIGQPVEFELKCPASPFAFRIWLQGETFFAFSKWHDAEIIYSGLIKADSAFCDGYFRLAQCYVAQNNLTEGYNILNIAKKKFPGNPQLNVGLGQMYTLLSYPKTALYYFQQQTLLFPDDPEGFLGASWILFELGREKDALVYLQTGRRLLFADLHDAGISRNANLNAAYTLDPPMSANIDYLYIFESMLYNRLSQNEKSLEALRQLESRGYDEDITALEKYVRGMYYYNKGEEFYERARKNLKKAIDAGIWVDAGIARQLGIRFDPSDFRSMALLEQYNDELKVVSRANKTPKADSVFQNRVLSEAADLYFKQLLTDSTNCHAILRLAECYRGLERHDEALLLYKSAVRYYPSEIRLQLLLARQLLQVGKTRESIVAYERATELDRNDFRGYYGACLAMAHQNEYEEALKFLQSGKTAIKNNGTRSTCLTGILYYQMGYFSDAWKIFSTQKIPGNGMAAYYRALTYHSCGKQFDAQAAENIFEAIRLGATVSTETIKMVGIDPKSPRFSFH